MNDLQAKILKEQPPRPLSLYEAHQQAVEEFHSSCHNFQAARERRDIAEKRLAEATANLAAAMQQANFDPTAQQDCAANTVGMQRGIPARF